MTPMVQVAVAEDATEAEELQEVLRAVGLEAQVQAESDADVDALVLLVPEDDYEAAMDALEAIAEPDAEADSV